MVWVDITVDLYKTVPLLLFLSELIVFCFINDSCAYLFELEQDALFHGDTLFEIIDEPEPELDFPDNNQFIQTLLTNSILQQLNEFDINVTINIALDLQNQEVIIQVVINGDDLSSLPTNQVNIANIITEHLQPFTDSMQLDLKVSIIHSNIISD